jgi:hypothetical protein
MSLEGTPDIAQDNQLQAGIDFLKKELSGTKQKVTNGK